MTRCHFASILLKNRISDVGTGQAGYTQAKPSQRIFFGTQAKPSQAGSMATQAQAKPSREHPSPSQANQAENCRLGLAWLGVLGWDFFVSTCGIGCGGLRCVPSDACLPFPTRHGTESGKSQLRTEKSGK